MAERDWIGKYFAPLAGTAGAVGLSDDTAQLGTWKRPVAVTTDAMVEGVHFLAADPIASIARKLVRVNVSDILSAGALPREALLTLGWPAGRPESELAVFAGAFGDELSRWNIALIGGDTVASPLGLFLSLTLTGECVGEALVRRGGAKPGDDLWVTGEIGGPRRGYTARAEGQASVHLAALLEPDLPPLGAAGVIAQLATAAMDVSDGLLGDAAQLAAASGLCAEVRLDAVPFAGGVSGPAEAIDLASWGDDYQLLFTSPAESREDVLRLAELKQVRISRIGRVSEGRGLGASWHGEAVNLPETIGFEHGRIGMPATRP
jgi:thiamine-monophosphate kinase